LVNLFSDETMRLAMNRRRRIGVGGLNEAEDLSVAPIHPVAEIADVVASLGLQVRLVSFAHVIEGDCTIEAVDIHIERHGSSFGRKFENDRRSA
jgi:hypothetical protein